MVIPEKPKSRDNINFIIMELLSKINQDVFNDFKDDEIKNLQSIHGESCEGRSGGAIVTDGNGKDWYCNWDEGDAVIVKTELNELIKN